jgi:nucleotide-binding universal stress UspA family protein
MLAIRNILVARDFSSVSTQALGYALGLAARTGAALHVLHAEVPYRAEASPTEGLDHLREALHRAGLASAEALGSVRVEGTVRRDVAAAPAILGYADDENVDLIVLGTHGRRGTSRIRLGSVAAEVVRHADRPVLTVWGEENDEAAEEGPPAPPGRILVPVDFSEHSREALRAGRAWAALYGAQVDVLHVVEEHFPSSLPFDPADAPSFSAEESDVEEQARAELEAFTEDRRDPAPETRMHVETGSPGASIIDFVADQEVDLVAISTHGRTGLRRFLLGSVTEKVIRHVRCPVLTLRAFGRSLPMSEEESTNAAD